VLITTIPVQTGWPAELGAHQITWTKVALFAVLAAWFVRWLLGRTTLVITTVIWWCAGYCGSLILSIVAARNIGAWAGETYRWLAGLAVLIIVASEIRTDRQRRPLLYGLAAGIALSGAIAGYQLVTGDAPPSFSARGLVRVYGMFGEPNPLAAYLEIAVLPLVGLSTALVVNRRSTRWTATGTFLLLAALGGTGILILTQSRGGALGFAFAFRSGVGNGCQFLDAGATRALGCGTSDVGAFPDSWHRGR
jgi:hypothetical protein